MTIRNMRHRGIKAFLTLFLLFATCSVSPAGTGPLSSASVDPFRTNRVVATYYPIWKKMFQLANGLSDAEFDRHIQVRKMYHDSELRDRDFLTVEYYVTVDWFSARQVATLDIMIPASGDGSAKVPRESYLSEEDVKLLAASRGRNAVGQANVTAPLLFRTLPAAVEKLKEVVGTASFSGSDIASQLIDGEPCLSVTATINLDGNSCRQAVLDLVTGASRVSDSPCFNIN